MAVLDDEGLQKVLDKIKNAANGCYTDFINNYKNIHKTIDKLLYICYY